jgi:hypothetical protein
LDATRGRSRSPPPPRRPPLAAAIATIPDPIANATPLAATAPECATIDATLASTTAPSRRPARAGPTWHRQPPPPPSISKDHRCRSRHPRRRHRPCRHLDRNLRLCLALRRVWEGLMALPPLSRPVRKKNAPRPRRIGAIAMLHFTRRARLYRLYRRVYRGTRVQSHVGGRESVQKRKRERESSRRGHPTYTRGARARVCETGVRASLREACVACLSGTPCALVMLKIKK